MYLLHFPSTPNLPGAYCPPDLDGFSVSLLYKYLSLLTYDALESGLLKAIKVSHCKLLLSPCIFSLAPYRNLLLLPLSLALFLLDFPR